MGEARDLVERNLESWNDHDLKTWRDDFDDHAQLAGPGGVSGTGPAMAEQFYALWQDAFPDTQVRSVTIAEDGDIGVLEALFEGTHTGPLRAPSGEVPPTGKRVSVPFVVVLRSSGGRATGFTLYFDQVELMTQLGLMPSPGAGGS